jgi:hypothetical protein
MNSTATLLDAAHHQLALGVYAYELEQLPWREMPRGTAHEKCVRQDDAAGLYLGLIRFDPLSRSGVHQHLGTATSFFLSGSLTDYQGTTGEGHVGINLAGATHDAVSYTGALLVSRLEGPVIIPDGGLAVHPYAAPAVLRASNVETPPDIAVRLDQALATPTRFAGVVRRTLFDYAGTGHDRRLCALTMWPKAPPVRVKHTAATDFFLLAGDLRVDGKITSGPAFILIEPDTEISLSSEYGCQLLAWAEGPARCPRSNFELYGFG